MATASHKVLPLCSSAFFRPEAAFAALQAWIMANLPDRACSEPAVRIWVPACGTGEQAYSIAMLLIEHLEHRAAHTNLQIFATDTEASFIRVARSGVYPQADIQGVGAARLERFFVRQGADRYCVNPTLRASVVFALHDIDTDPPLSHLDLVDGHGALSRVPAESRQRLVSLLHFALNHDGHLMLGPAQVLTPSSDLFQAVDVEGCLYRRLGAAGTAVSSSVRHGALQPAHQAEPFSTWFADSARRSLPTLPPDGRLLSAHEDLIASREKLLSLNEELAAINSQLAARVDQLELARSEMANRRQHSEKEIRAILDATADAVVTIDVLDHIASFNRAAERIFGYTAAEVIGESVNLLIPPQGQAGRHGYEVTASRSYCSRLIGRTHELAGRRKDGGIFPIQLSVNAVEGRDLLVGVARDMTEHKALQKEIIDVAMLEQRRIGQELHDGTQQELTGLGLLAQSLAESLSRSNSTAASQVAARVARGIELCNQRVRSLARGMVPVPIDREGLMSSLAELARQTTEIHGIPCGFECPAPVELDNDSEATHLYRIAQEASSNATRHARASAIWIRLEQVDGRLVLEVQDTGIGMPATPAGAKGVGLRLMEHRCAMIGGNFSIEPRPDGGTCIVCSVLRTRSSAPARE